MAVVLLWFALPVCFSCNAHATPKNRAKVVEDYVVSAKFDENNNFPQLRESIRPKDIRQKNGATGTEEDLPESREGSLFLAHGREDFEDSLEERDLLVHHHHLPPPPPPAPPVPPPPPPPAGLAYAPSLFAVGLITFLILLNSLQTSLLLTLKPKNSLLGAVTQPLGRRKRFVSGWKHVRRHLPEDSD